MASTMPSVTFDGKQYALPYSYYQWGVYYRKDIFAKYGLGIPKSWGDFLYVSSTLKLFLILLGSTSLSSIPLTYRKKFSKPPTKRPAMIAPGMEPKPPITVTIRPLIVSGTVITGDKISS